MPLPPRSLGDFAESIKQKADGRASQDEPPGAAVARQPKADGGGDHHHRDEEDRAVQEGVEGHAEGSGLRPVRWAVSMKPGSDQTEIASGVDEAAADLAAVSVVGSS